MKFISFCYADFDQFFNELLDVREGFCLVPEVSIYRWRIKFPKDLWNQLRSCLIPQVGGPFFQVL